MRQGLHAALAPALPPARARNGQPVQVRLLPEGVQPVGRAPTAQVRRAGVGLPRQALQV